MTKNATFPSARTPQPRLPQTDSAAWGGKCSLLLLFLLFCPMLYAARASGAGESGGAPMRKLSVDLRQFRNRNVSGTVKVVVQFKQRPTSGSISRFRNVATMRGSFPGIRAVAMTIPVSSLALLESSPDVAYVTVDRQVQMSTADEDYVTAVEADIAAAQFGFDGTGVGVAVIDSGVADHADLHNADGSSRLVYSESFVPGDPSTTDKYGHGSHVAGLIAGNGASSNATSGYARKYAGMAPGVNIINLRVLDQNGSGTDSQVIAAIQRAIALQSTYNIRVINLSLGRPVFESYTLDPLDQAVESAWKAGIVVVVAAGNAGRDNSMHTHGYATIGSPGNDPAVITVGATRTRDTATRVDDVKTSYSSKGPTLLDHIVKPDLVAPGNRLVSLRSVGSTLDVEYPQFEVAPTTGAPAKYFRLSGTSMATPVVSAAIALVLQQNSSLTPDQVKARLMKTAWKGFSQYSSAVDTLGNIYSDEYDIFSYGAGYLDVDAALNSSDLSQGVALSPTAMYDATTGNVYLANTDSTLWGSSVVWGNSIVWGTSIVWGNALISGTSIVWGNSVVWGTSTDQGFSIVWGTSVTGGGITAFSTGDDGED